MAPLSRRRFLQLSSTAAGLALTEVNPLGASPLGLTVEGYASATSVFPGEAIQVHARSSRAATMRLKIVRVGGGEVLMRVRTVRVGNYSTSPDAPEVGCGWPPLYTFTIPATWPSGCYRVDVVSHRGLFPRTGPAQTLCYFVVKARQPTSPMLLAFTVTTAQAYNGWPEPWPGKSLYLSDAPTRLRHVSFDRPDTHPHYMPQQLEFLTWLAGNGYVADYCTSLDLHTDPAFLGQYQLLLSVGHDEYWSKEMRDHVEAFIAQGGNAAFFSANTCYWQVRFAQHNRTMVCYKNAHEDPLTGVDNDRVMVEWRNAPVNRPENTLTGVGTLHGAACFRDFAAMDHKAYQVRFAKHWVFDGTGLADGEVFGQGERIVGYETDAADFVEVDGFPVVTGSDGTPPSFVILATADLRDWGPAGQAGWATMGLYHRQGTVFTAGTTDWVSGFRFPQSAVHHITRNVLNRLCAPYPARQWEVIGHADSVVGMAAVAGKLFAASADHRLWWREPIGQEINWYDIGHANDVVAMAAWESATRPVTLVAAARDGRIGWREPVGYDVYWTDMERVAQAIVAMAITHDSLFVATRNHRLLMKPLAGPGAWQDVGHANDVVAMTAVVGTLVAAARDGGLWWRKPVCYEVNWQPFTHLEHTVGLAALGDKLFAATSDRRLWWREAVLA